MILSHLARSGAINIYIPVTDSVVYISTLWRRPYRLIMSILYNWLFTTVLFPRSSDTAGHAKIFGWAKSLPPPSLTITPLSFLSPSPSIRLSSLPRSRPLSTARGLGSAVSSPSRVSGEAPAESDFGAFQP